MKRYLLLVWLLFACALQGEGQNLVPNPSFEEYDSLTFYVPDSSIHHLYFPTHWFVPVSCWYCTYFNSKLNYVDTTGGMGISQYGVPQNPWSYTYPYDGIAQSGFCPFTVSPIEGFRNYLEVKLKTPLIQDHKYCVSFFVTLADTSYIAIDQIGVSFTNDTLQHFTPFNGNPCYLLQTPQVVSPQGVFLNVRNQWQNISGTFIAQGGEQFLTIGNFKTDSNTNYVWLPDVSTYGPGSNYHIDMVSVIECDTNIVSAYAGKRSQICLGDSVMLGLTDSLPGYEFAWSPGAGLSDSCIQNPMASPLQTTIYTLTQTYYNSNLTTDTVSVIVDSCNSSVNEFMDNQKWRIWVYPNPARDILFIESPTKIITAEIYDLTGKLIFTKPLSQNQIDIRSLAKGLYFIKLSTEGGRVVRKFVKE